MTYKPIINVNTPIGEMPLVCIDTETTGVRPGIDAVVEVGIARLEAGNITTWSSRVNPHRPIPAEATAVHGIRDEDVAGCPILADVMMHDTPQRLLRGAQPLAYNAPFDREFIPPQALDDYTWPWLDVLPMVRKMDRFVRGEGRHKLENACRRHGVTLGSAHSAGDDAEASLRLFLQLVEEGFFPDAWRTTVGEAIRITRVAAANDWFSFHVWLASRPA